MFYHTLVCTAKCLCFDNVMKAAQFIVVLRSSIITMGLHKHVDHVCLFTNVGRCVGNSRHTHTLALA